MSILSWSGLNITCGPVDRLGIRTIDQRRQHELLNIAMEPREQDGPLNDDSVFSSTEVDDAVLSHVDSNKRPDRRTREADAKTVFELAAAPVEV